MRVSAAIVVIAALATASSPVFAQGSTGFTMGDIYAAHAVVQARAAATSMSAPDSPFSRLSKDSRAWILAECKRQAENPRAPQEVFESVDAAIADDVGELARHQRMDPHDISLSVLLMVMADTEDAAGKAARKARKSGDPAAVEAAANRLAQATAQRKEAFAMQTEVSMALAMM